MIKKQDLVYSWGMPIIGIPISIFIMTFGWLILNTASLGVSLFGMFFFATGIIGLGASILMFIDVKKGKISPMFV